MQTEDARLDRRIRNERLFRSVNSKLRDLNAQFEGFAGETALFVCECSRLECIEQVAVAVAVFDDIQNRPAHFILVPGHESLDLEFVVDRVDGYVVVEKPSLS